MRKLLEHLLPIYGPAKPFSLDHVNIRHGGDACSIFKCSCSTLSQVRLAEIALPAREENRKGIRPLAVSVDEASKMLGVSSCTLRRRVADGEIRTIRLGRRVLVPMDVMERVTAEGMDKERR
jgi:excisionase family DNA binding protein